VGAAGTLTNTRTEFDNLLWIYGGVTGAVFVIIVALIAYTVVRSRRRASDPGFRTGWPRAEAFYAVVLAAVVAVLVAFTFRTENRVDKVAANPGLELDVTAFQWQWAFTYPNGVTTVGTREEPAELVVPADTTVRFTMISRDVIHSFWIPELRFKRDAFPLKATEFDLVFPDEGTFQGHCAEYCGLRHANMLFQVTVLSPEEFDAWLAEKAAEQA
jgi:cytochrome c oxidase subunit 2